jgi:Type VI secretion system/phage-baseplate injector OB domain
MPIAPQPIPTPAPKQYLGKYRGIVSDNVDPLQLGRMLAQVPDLPGQIIAWALPCLPYVTTPGILAVPPVGTDVWIEFEQGNIDYPIWSGCFWTSGHPPLL